MNANNSSTTGQGRSSLVVSRSHNSGALKQPRHQLFDFQAGIVRGFYKTVLSLKASRALTFDELQLVPKFSPQVLHHIIRLDGPPVRADRPQASRSLLHIDLRHRIRVNVQVLSCLYYQLALHQSANQGAEILANCECFRDQ